MSQDESESSVGITWKFRQVELGRILSAYRKLRGEDRRLAESRMLSWLDAHKAEAGWDELRRIAPAGKLAKLESPGLADEILTLPNIEPLTCAYEIPELLLGSLLSKPQRHVYVAHRPEVDFERIDKKIGCYCGEETRYSIPPTRLSDAENIAIVYHELEAGGHSLSHNHPGDEILYVDEGLVEVRMEDTGLWVRLDKGSFIHFEAGQLHSAWNCSDKTAKMFIIRYLQLSSGTRLDVLREVASLKPSKRLIKTILEDIRCSVWTPLEQQEYLQPDQVCDRRGLGRFLELLCSERFLGDGHGGLTYNDLHERSETKQYDYSRSKLARLHYGEAPVKKEQLLELADIYRVAPILFYNFLFPAFRYAIAVQDKDEKGMRLIPREFGSSDGVVYKVPHRRLAYSDIAIATATLSPRESTPENRHPGYELLKPLEGEVAVKFGTTGHPPITRGEYALFCSDSRHRVCNFGEAPARVLIIRFLE